MNNKQKVTLGIGLIGLFVLVGVAIALLSRPSADVSAKRGFGVRTPTARADIYLAGVLNDTTNNKRGFGLRYPFTIEEKRYSLEPLTTAVRTRIDQYGNQPKSIVVKGKLRSGSTINVSDSAIIPLGVSFNGTGKLTKRTGDTDWQYTFKAVDGTEYRATTLATSTVSLASVIDKNVQVSGISYKYEFLKETINGLYISEAKEVAETSTKPVIDSITPTSAGPGGEIVIKGENLSENNSDGKTYFSLILGNNQQWSFAKSATDTELVSAIPLRFCKNMPSCSDFETVTPGEYQLSIEVKGNRSNTVTYTVK